MKEAQTKQGDVLIPTFIEEKEGMGEIKNLVEEKIEASKEMEELELEDTDIVKEEE